ncbi:MAG TPA: hypothetical protein VK615_16365 [Candidatus Binatia bacterium]|nr:hypothetical protein [Candidatus Binatia bacterium]
MRVLQKPTLIVAQTHAFILEPAAQSDYIASMSLTQLKEKAAALTPPERLELAAFLAELEEQSESEFRQTVDERMKAIDSGKRVTHEQFEAEHIRRSKS